MMVRALSKIEEGWMTKDKWDLFEYLMWIVLVDSLGTFKLLELCVWTLSAFF